MRQWLYCREGQEPKDGLLVLTQQPWQREEPEGMTSPPPQEGVQEGIS